MLGKNKSVCLWNMFFGGCPSCSPPSSFCICSVSTLVGSPCSDTWNRGHGVGIGEALSNLDEVVLDSSYWLCIFALNEHKSICGQRWTCNPKTSEELKAPTCIKEGFECFGKPRRLPCPCGSVKKRGDHLKVLRNVLGSVDEVVVSLDEDLATLQRVWCLLEAHEAGSRSGAINSGPKRVFS